MGVMCLCGNWLAGESSEKARTRGVRLLPGHPPVVAAVRQAPRAAGGAAAGPTWEEGSSTRNWKSCGAGKGGRGAAREQMGHEQAGHKQAG